MANPFASINWPELTYWVAVSIGGGLGMYFGVGGLFELVWYRGRRDEAARWKCQPKRFPTPAMRRSEILLGSANLLVASACSGVLIYYLVHGGASAVYFRLDERPIALTLATTLLYIFGVDYALYWAHRIYHVPALFRAIHRVHHRYTAPTAFTAMAMHPVEFATYQIISALPMFFLPIWVGSVIAILLYTNLVALIDHSGIKIYSINPLQPPSVFHDDHHVYFHVNYGQNFGLWDRLHGTWRRYGRAYGPGVFGGRGAALREQGGQGAREPDAFVDYSKGAAERSTDQARNQAEFEEGSAPRPRSR